MNIYQICPNCKGTGKNPAWSKNPGGKCYVEGCKDGYVLWGKLAEGPPVKKGKA